MGSAACGLLLSTSSFSSLVLHGIMVSTGLIIYLVSTHQLTLTLFHALTEHISHILLHISYTLVSAHRFTPALHLTSGWYRHSMVRYFSERRITAASLSHAFHLLCQTLRKREKKKAR